MMIKIYVLFVLISFTYECAPTVPVSTTTISPNATTTTQPSNISTTSTIATTTTTGANNCCQWPMAPEFVNTADPVQQSWNGCNQSVFFNCTFSNTTLYTEEVGIAVNFGQSFSLDKENNVRFTNQRLVLTSISCNPTDHLWYPNGTGVGYEQFACAYELVNGTWVRGLPMITSG
ncbi:C6 domain-containing protein [Caenorhabditis elegans]|uniref:C6 domain-containing protein n=1 Tax=Caenorhabditis elegans TaxID=6239 RepID=O62187_CAEEL|nr:C6 domain-containing protein [Caenorhabditis elegans]CAB04221.2 C6 domain-containing protein [Caenorhabditis elegans]